MLPKQLRELSKRDAENKEVRIVEITILVSEVENLKQIHLSDDERTALIKALDALPETTENIKSRAKSLITNKDYNRIPYDAWLSVQPLYTLSEARKMAFEIIEQRKLELQRIGYSEEELAKEGLAKIETIAWLQYGNLLEREMSKVKVRVKKCRAFFLAAPDEIKLEIKAIAESKGLIKDDPFWLQSIPVLMPHVLGEVEKIIRRIK